MVKENDEFFVMHWNDFFISEYNFFPMKWKKIMMISLCFYLIFFFTEIKVHDKRKFQLTNSNFQISTYDVSETPCSIIEIKSTVITWIFHNLRNAFIYNIIMIWMMLKIFTDFALQIRHFTFQIQLRKSFINAIVIEINEFLLISLIP